MRPRAFKDLAQLCDAEFFVEVARGMRLCAGTALIHWRDALLLESKGRRAGCEILRGYAEEESAKVLILLDSVRCPRKSGEELARQLGYCADHLAKGIYADLYDLPHKGDFSDLRSIVGNERKDLYIDGPNGWDWILRNDILTLREQPIYVDYVDEGDRHQWWDPARHSRLFGAKCFGMPGVLAVTRSLRRAGFMSPKSLDLVAAIWRKVVVQDGVSDQDQRQLNHQTLQAMSEKGLLGRASEADYEMVIDRWLLPLYPLDLRLETVNRKELRKSQKAKFLGDVVGNDSF